MTPTLRFSTPWRLLVRVIATVLFFAALTLAGVYAFASP